MSIWNVAISLFTKIKVNKASKNVDFFDISLSVGKNGLPRKQLIIFFALRISLVPKMGK